MNVANRLASGSIGWFVSELAYGKERVSSALGCFDGVPL
jgi:hypothetical protein